MIVIQQRSKLSGLGICPICLELKEGFKDYDQNDIAECYKNICPHCNSEAITVGRENLLNFLIASDLEKIEAHWTRPETRQHFQSYYCNEKMEKIQWLKKLKQDFINGGSEDMEIGG
ncbi:MAG: hypothetical protein JWO06_421 [Bacteroidota bacterium]|nr:hypothetical protein [Bacteroidota bacterium]